MFLMGVCVCVSEYACVCVCVCVSEYVCVCLRVFLCYYKEFVKYITCSCYYKIHYA